MNTQLSIFTVVIIHTVFGFVNQLGENGRNIHKDSDQNAPVKVSQVSINHHSPSSLPKQFQLAGIKRYAKMGKKLIKRQNGEIHQKLETFTSGEIVRR